MALFKKKKSKKNTAVNFFKEDFLTEDSPFAVREAYKMIRTNLLFSIPGDGCKKIIITSSTQGEAKSTTAVNLSVALAQNNCKVLLIDCDLRLPTIGLKLGIKKKRGLSNVLAGMCSIESSIVSTENGIDIITAGSIPPNPTELLGSAEMGALLRFLEKDYDYIILDTPPVNAVADVTVLTKFCDGVIMVVRQNLARKERIQEAIQKLEFSNSKILGFVFTDVKNEKFTNYKSGYSYGYGK